MENYILHIAQPQAFCKHLVKFTLITNKVRPSIMPSLVLDNHSAHTSNETQAFLATVSGRLEFVFTPKYGSWLNMIESYFGKMTNQMLRGIRVQSKEELADRIYRYFNEVNATSVVHHQRYKMDEIDPTEKATVGLIIN